MSRNAVTRGRVDSSGLGERIPAKVYVMTDLEGVAGAPNFEEWGSPGRALPRGGRGVPAPGGQCRS